MSILVTGGAGYIGSHMVWRLLDAGEQVVVLDRLSTGFEWAVPREAELVVGDVGDEALVGTLLRVSVGPARKGAFFGGSHAQLADAG